MGCRGAQTTRLLAAGELVPLLPGIYRSAQWPQSANQAMSALCQRNPDAIIAFTSAARIWEFRKIPPENVIHVLVPHGHTPEIAGAVIHRCRRIDSVDIVRRTDGVRLTSPPRTMFDIADMIGPHSTASVLEQVINEKRFTFGTLIDTIDRLGHPSRPGTRTLRAVIASRPAWRRAMQSDLEARVLTEITAQGLPAPNLQYSVSLGSGRDIRIDFAWPDQRVALEVDHPFWHDGASESHADKCRDRKLSAMGWRTPRLTSFDVESGLREAVQDVGAILAVASIA
ncbi:MAG: hypothetical protein ABIQ39_11480 [Ilumatobacteraceae bacterium]